MFQALFQSSPWYRVILYGILAILLTPLTIGFAINLRHGSRVRAYERLKAGMDRAKVEESFGRSPDLVLHVGKCPCAYFEGIAPFAQEVPKTAADAESIETLPDIYDAVLVVYDEQQSVIVHSWIGETLETPTILGNFPTRGGIPTLPPDILKALNTRCGL